MTEALRAREQRIIELHRVEVQVALHILEPFHGITRRRLQAQHFRAARVLVFGERRLHVWFAVKIICHGYCALHSELGARTDGEMRRGGGIAHQHDILVRPLLAENAWEIQPRRAADVRCIRYEAMAAEVTSENALASAAGFILAHGAEAELLPSRLRALDDKSRGIGVELVGVRPGPAVLGLLEDESESVVEFLLGAEPDEFVLAQIDGWFEIFGELFAGLRIQSVRRNDEVVILRQRRGAGDLGLESEADTKLAR